METGKKTEVKTGEPEPEESSPIGLSKVRCGIWKPTRHPGLRKPGSLGMDWAARAKSHSRCYNAAMPSCLLICESCGTRQVVFLEDGVAGEIRNGKTFNKHCLCCRGMTEWAFLSLDRRGGQDRRGSHDRRANPSSGEEPL